MAACSKHRPSDREGRKLLGESDKAFFRGSLFNWPHVDTAGHATVSVLIFPRAPELCGSLLCQDFLAEILICLPSRLSVFSFVWLAPCGCWGKGFLGIISIPGYSHPVLVIQYQNNILYSCTPPCSSNQRCCRDYFCTSHISILTSCLNTLVSAFPDHFTSVSYGEGEDTRNTHSNNSATNMLMKWQCGGNINLLGDRLVLPLPRRLPFGSWWPLFASVPRHWHLATKAKEEREPASVQWLKYTQTHKHICSHQRNKQTREHTQLKLNEQTHMHMRTNWMNTDRKESKRKSPFRNKVAGESWTKNQGQHK